MEATSTKNPAAGGALAPPRRFLPRLCARRNVWWPTFAGWMLLVSAFIAMALGWWFRGEDFLAVTDRRGTDVLVVEGWIGNTGIGAAATEFLHGGYRYIVATGGLTSDRWDTQQWSYAEMAQRDLLAAGVPQAAVLLAIPRETNEQRTFESALAARSALDRPAVHPRSVTVFTFGAHARRSRMIYAKVFRPNVPVGVIAWCPAEDFALPWWHSSDRAEDLLKETVGFLLELFFNSGRGFGHT